MVELRKSGGRGRTVLDWLDSRHTFSFGRYHDPRHAGFRALRVINEDRVKPGGGFPVHGHRDMEIVTYVLEGSLRHQDSLGNGSVLRPGDVQRMTAGTGILHSEVNASDTEPLWFLQIWILPRRRGLEPGYEERSFGSCSKRGRLRRIVSGGGLEGALSIHQDAEGFACLLAPGEKVVHPLARGRAAWVQLARGAVTLNGTPLEAGDGAAVAEEASAVMVAAEPSELLLLDLA